MATSVEERRTQFRWMDKLSDEDVTAVALAEPGTSSRTSTSTSTRRAPSAAA